MENDATMPMEMRMLPTIIHHAFVYFVTPDIMVSLQTLRNVDSGKFGSLLAVRCYCGT